MEESELDVLREIRELLTVIAEPQLAERDKVRRAELRRIAGRGEKTMRAVLLMDGSRTQASIAKEVPIDAGQLSSLVRTLREAKLLKESASPAVVIPVSEAIFKE